MVRLLSLGSWHEETQGSALQIKRTSNVPPFCEQGGVFSEGLASIMDLLSIYHGTAINLECESHCINVAEAQPDRRAGKGR